MGFIYINAMKFEVHIKISKESHEIFINIIWI